jgi:hypothetical protein
VLLAAVLGVAATAVPAASALPLDHCGPRESSTAFSQWGDRRSYFLMPGGSFERGTRGWALANGSAIVQGNETYFARAATDHRSVRFVRESSVVSPTTCVALGEAWVRFFVRNPGVAGSFLHVQAFVQDRLTGLVLSTGFDISGGSGAIGWSPSPAMLVPNLLGGITGAENLTLVFTATGAAAAWGIDDVFVDPFKSR